MTDLYSRILLWHKLLAMQTGGLALCSAKHRLNRDEARGWSTAARNVADDIEAFLDTGAFILDDRGQRMVWSSGEDKVSATLNQIGERHHAPQPDPLALSAPAKIPDHPSNGKTVGRKSGGLRVARRKVSFP